MARGEEERRQGPEMGYRGSLYQGAFRLVEELTVCQQLLAIWNRAKGKERDALLWGDEVIFPSARLLVDVNVLHDWLGRIPRCVAR